MTARSVLEEARRRGVELRADPERNLVLYRPKSAVDAELLEAIRRHKPQLLEALQAERAREALVDEAWRRLQALHHRAGRPSGWLTEAVRAVEEEAEALWRAARRAPSFDADFRHALTRWEDAAAAAIRRAAEREETT